MSPKRWRDLLVDVQRRVPARKRTAQEAFSRDHRRRVMVGLNDLTPDTFYRFDDITSCACFEAAFEWAARQRRGELTVSYTVEGETRSHIHRLQHAAGHLDSIRVLAVGKPGRALAQGARIEWSNIRRTPLARYRMVIAETPVPLLFIVREEPPSSRRALRYLGFFSADREVIGEIGEDVEVLRRGEGRRLETFEQLELLHRTTQRVARELESYSSRIERAAQLARRRPDLLTPARFERIVAEAINKMEELKEIPRQALRRIGSGQR